MVLSFLFEVIGDDADNHRIVFDKQNFEHSVLCTVPSSIAIVRNLREPLYIFGGFIIS